MRRVVTGLAIVAALILTTGTAMAHEHEHWGYRGYYPAYRPVVVAPAPTYTVPAAVYPAPVTVYGTQPVVVAPAPAVVAPAPYCAPGLHSSLYLRGRHFGIGVGF